ncbi:hypothetical protein Taro_001375 [Colocasia esculenta]|uniref:Uncharacterized protein n=1 Tax=Colocasia esculenta TaxID=4460 RepID=A0A843T9N6_COLES|nr:hypothetical protein [Colocasia esculenta]
MRGRSSRPRCRKVLYFPHRRLWIMEYSCKVWCKPCRRRLIPRQHSRHSWRLRQELGINALDAEIPGVRPAILSSIPGTARDRRQVRLDRTVNCVVGDTPLEEIVESDSERGEKLVIGA